MGDQAKPTMVNDRQRAPTCFFIPLCLAGAE